MRKETQLGLFILLGIIAIAVTIMTIQSVTLAKGYRLNITFNDVSNLMDKAWVRISGVKAGKVESITLYDKKVKVTVWIKDNVKIHNDAAASIQSTGILGVKYIELTLGSDDAPLFKNGDFIEGKDLMSLDKMLSDGLGGVGKLTKSLGEIVSDGSLGKNLNELLKNAKEISEKLNRQLDEKKLANIVDNLEEFSRQAKKLSQDLAEITGDEKTDIKLIVKNVKSSTEKLDNILTKVTNGETTIGRLLADEQMGNDLKSTVESLKVASNEAKKTISRFTLFRSYWDYELRYSAIDKEYKSDIGIQIRPNPDKYYFLGVSNAGDPAAISGEKVNTLDLNIGKDLKLGDQKFATVYAGILRSSGGLGLSIKPMWMWNPWNRLDVFIESYDFARVTASGVKKPRINAGAKVKPAKWLALGSAIEDINEKSDVHTSVNLVLEDEDLSYLLGLIGLVGK
ncbi:MAG: MCE family protein [Elusimicrobia bacterium]|nr:MCE family protein [Elusimicrobiota bacterium]